MENILKERSGSKCELCSAEKGLHVYEVAPVRSGVVEDSSYLCKVCVEQLDEQEPMDVNHWRCLNDSMWSQVPAVQVLAWRMLNRLRSEGWPQELLEMLYLEDDLLEWAKAGLVEEQSQGSGEKHLDSNGAPLESGDSVTLIKDLNVKGGGFTAKRGTTVRNIGLVADNPEHIEGRVSGQRIVILTKFVKKAG